MPAIRSKDHGLLYLIYELASKDWKCQTFETMVRSSNVNRAAYAIIVNGERILE